MRKHLWQGKEFCLPCNINHNIGISSSNISGPIKILACERSHIFTINYIHNETYFSRTEHLHFEILLPIYSIFKKHIYSSSVLLFIFIIRIFYYNTIWNNFHFNYINKNVDTFHEEICKKNISVVIFAPQINNHFSRQNHFHFCHASKFLLLGNNGNWSTIQKELWCRKGWNRVSYKLELESISDYIGAFCFLSFKVVK